MKMKKKAISALLMLTMAAAFVGKPATSPASAASYTPEYINTNTVMPYYPVMTAAMTADSSFVRNFDDNIFNFADEFGLNYNMKHTTNFSYEIEDPMDRIRDHGDISYINRARFGATMEGDKHRYVPIHIEQLECNLRFRLAAYALEGPGGDDTISSFYTNSKTGEEFHYIGRNGISSIAVEPGYYNICPCGSPKFSKPIVNLADVTYPTLTENYVTFEDPMGDTAPERTDGFKIADLTPGNTEDWDDLYFHFAFSEDVRFADGYDHENVYLGVELMDIASNQEVGKIFYAQIYAIRGNVVSFKLDTEDLIDGDGFNDLPDGMELNHYLHSYTDIVMFDDPSVVTSAFNTDYDLTYFVKGVDMTALDDDGNNGEYKDVIKAYENNDKLNTVNSLFTDMVGNPVVAPDFENIARFYSVYMDSVHPYVESVSIDVYDVSWNLRTIEVENGDEVNSFIKPGDTIRFTVRLSESVEDLNEYPLYITTNIKNSNDEYVRGNMRNFGNKRDENVNNPILKTFYTYDLLVTDDMVPPADGQIMVTGFGECRTGGEIRDYFRNSMVVNPKTGTMFPVPDKKLSLDTLPPIVTVKGNQDEQGYVATIVDEDNRIIRLDFSIEDATDHGLAHVSGLVGTQGLYANLRVGELTLQGWTYEYAILPEGQTPTEEDFMDGVKGFKESFMQVEGQGYSLYIKLPSYFDAAAFPVECSLAPKDFAGNTAEHVFTISSEGIGDLLDKDGPEVNVNVPSYRFDNDTNEGGIAVTFTVKDKTGVNADTLQYAFVDRGVTPTESDWAYVKADFPALESAKELTVAELMYKGALGTEAKALDFYVRADDTTKNTENVTVFGPVALDYDMNYHDHTATVEEKTALSKPKILLQGVTDTAWAWALYRPIDPEAYFGEGGYFTNGEYLLTRMYVGTDNAVDVLSPGLIGMGPDYGDVNSSSRRSFYVQFDEATETFTLLDDGVDYTALQYIFDGQFYGKVEARYFVSQYLDVEFDANGVGQFSFPEGTVDPSQFVRPIYRSPVYEMWYAGTPSADVVESVLDATVEWIKIDETLTEKLTDTWTPGDTKNASLTTLAGEIIEVNVTANLDAYGVDLLDKENSYLRVMCGDNVITDVLYEHRITEGTMRVILPDDITYDTTRSEIHLSLHIESTLGGVNFTKDFYRGSGIYVDPVEPTDFGVAAVITLTDNPAVAALPASVTTVTGETIGYLRNVEWYGYALDNQFDIGDSGIGGGDSAWTALYPRPDRIILNAYEDTEDRLGVDHYIMFTQENGDTRNDDYMQVSNTTTGVIHEGVWTDYFAVNQWSSGNGTYYTVVVYDSVEALNSATHAANEIPVVANMDNVISYRKVRGNGLASPVYTMILYPDTVMDDIVVELIPSHEGAYVQGITGVIKSVPAGSVLYRYNPEASAWEPFEDVKFDAFTGDYTKERFFAVDAEGNLTYTDVEMPAGITIRNSKPKVTVGTYAVTDNVMAMNIAITDDQNGFFNDYGGKLHVSFDEAYATHLGITDMTYDLLPLGDDMTQNFKADETNRGTGIYSFTMRPFDNGTGLSIEEMCMVHRYDRSLGEGETASVTLTLQAEDSIGNLSDPVTVTLNFKNTEPKVLGVEMNQNTSVESVSDNKTFNAPQVHATVPVLEVYPATTTDQSAAEYATMWTTDAGGAYYWIKPFVDTYRAGEYEISILDMFGDLYTATIDYPEFTFINPNFGVEYSLDMDIQFSEPDPETGLVTLYYQSMDERIFVDIAQTFGTLGELVPGQSSAAHTVLAEKVNKAEVELNPNRPLLILLYDPDEEATNNTIAYMNTMNNGGARHFIIPSFFKREVTAEVYWYFTETGTSYEEGDPYMPATTSGNVTAYLRTSRNVEGVTQYTFTYGGETTYTFRYADLSGVKGEYTATLPTTITAPVADPGDTTAPEYEMDVYGKYSLLYENMGMYASRFTDITPSEVVRMSGYAQGYMLSFRINDESPVKFVVKAEGTGNTVTSYGDAVSDTIDGITVSGTQVLIDKMTGFDVVLIDSAGNKTVVSFSAEDFVIDTTPPFVAAQIPVANSLYMKTVYILLEDDYSTADQIRWIAPANVQKMTTGDYVGHYALVFEKNQTISVTFEDANGNIGTAEITVSDLDASSPIVTDVSWIPAASVTDTSQPPNRVSNRDVVASVEFDRTIKDLTIADAVNSYPADKINVVIQGSQAVLTFTDSNTDTNGDLCPWELTLTYAGLNGVEDTHTLTLGAVIDKVAPDVYCGYTENASTPKAPYVEIVFENLTEDCYMTDTGSKLYKAGEPITKQITENGTHFFHFTDAAGNKTTREVTVGCIDNEAPIVLLKDLPDIDAAFTNQNVTIKATLNEAGTITIAGQTATIPAPVDANGNGVFDDNECVWGEFVISENGGYTIVAEDMVGLVSQNYVSVNHIDKTAPVISFAPTTLTLIQGTPRVDVLALLSKGASGWDNRSTSENITITYDTAAVSDAMLSAVGVHTIPYTAVDEAGNRTEGTRFLKIFSADEMQVTLNGQKTFPSEILILNSTGITLDISNLPDGDGEPYSVYFRMGKWKEGQMKTRAEKLNSLVFTAEKNKYYTIYIVTQSRGTYITHFYVQ